MLRDGPNSTMASLNFFDHCESVQETVINSDYMQLKLYCLNLEGPDVSLKIRLPRFDVNSIDGHFVISQHLGFHQILCIF